MRTRTAAAAALLTLVLAATPAAAVTRGGIPDAGEHPMTGQLLFYVPDVENGIFEDTGGWFTCSGTLINSEVVVTAGHCAFGIGIDGESTTDGGEITTAAEGGVGGTDVWISFNEGDSGDADTEPEHWEGWPLTFDAEGNLNFDTERERYEARVAWLESNPLWVQGTAYPHPEYDDNAFFIHDVGALILDEAQPGPYASIPTTAGYLDKYAGRRNNHLFEVVGYGLNASLKGGKIGVGGDTRMKADVRLLNIVSNPKNTYMQLSNNPSTGGTCFGDSGGPTFDTTTSTLIVAVTSFGLSPNCTGIGGAYRIDQADDLAFLADVLALAD
jgi:hypothetical protein